MCPDKYIHLGQAAPLSGLSWCLPGDCSRLVGEAGCVSSIELLTAGSADEKSSLRPSGLSTAAPKSEARGLMELGNGAGGLIVLDTGRTVFEIGY